MISILFLVFLGACSNESGNSDSSKSNEKKSETAADKKETKMFTMDSGEKVEMPAEPERIVVLHPTYVGALIKFGHKPVGVPHFVDDDEVLKKATEGIDRIDTEKIETITNLKPDVIIGTPEDPNLNKYKKIAPTVTFDAMISTYEDNTRLLGELVNEKDQADTWIKEWKEKMDKDSKELGPLIKDKTLAIFQSTPKGLVSFDTDYGRGGAVVYDGYGFKQPEALAKATKDQFNVELSTEELPKYAGGFIILATDGTGEAPIEKSSVWENLEAVKDGKVLRINLSETRYNDPISLEAQRDILKSQFDKMK